jgi:membrane protein
MIQTNNLNSFIQSRTFMSLVLTAVVIRILFITHISLIDYRPLEITHSYFYSHYLLTYDLVGFAPRALAGTVFNYIVVLFNPLSFLITLYLLTVGAYLVIARLFVQCLRRSKNQLFLLLLGALIYANPVMFLYAGKIGMLDFYNLLLLLVAVWMLYIPEESRLFWIIPPVIATGILVHETFIFFCVPVILAVMSVKLNWKRLETGILFLSSCLTVVVLFLLLYFAKKNMPSTEVLDNMLRENNYLGLYPNEHVGLGPYTNEQTYFDHVVHVFNHFTRWNRIDWIVLLLDFLSFLPMFILFGTFWKIIYRQMVQKKLFGKFRRFFLIAAPQTGFAMIFIGTDYPRWLAMIFFANALVMFLLATDRKFNLDLSLNEKSGILIQRTSIWSLFYLSIGAATMINCSSLFKVIAVFIYAILRNS